MKEVFFNNLRKFRIYSYRSLKYDLVSAVVVLLVAIPLCLGIALASGAPLLSGIISGIVGGILVGILSNSQVSVSGPAAGMAAVVLTAITQLGDFNTFLLALTFAGIIQIIIGKFRAGFFADYIPSNVVQGLLCAIGILLIVKQLPLAFTFSTDLKELKAHLLQTTESITLSPLYDLMQHINIGAAGISAISFVILIYMEKTKIKYLKGIPASVIVVISGILINELFLFVNSSFYQSNLSLVNIPRHGSVLGFFEQFQFPNWSKWNQLNVYFYAFIIAIVASLESLLNVKAAEKIDRKRRYCSKDQELVAQGVGNLVSGLIGGIPVTSVIVRTSVNVQSGSKTKVSTILHGIFILFSVVLVSNVLNKIPLASLAVILIFTGYKLTKPIIYKNIYQQGMDRFIPFIVTVLSIVLLNLLTGILIGLSISLFYILKTNSQARLDIVKETYPYGLINRLILPQHITFLNKASLISELNSIPKNSQFIIDARYAHYIDKEILELIKEFQLEQAPQKEISLNLVGFKDRYEVHNYTDFINVTTYDILAKLKPYQALNILREGNHRFLNDTKIHRSATIDIKSTAETQHPIAIVLSCIDSRVPVETIFDMGFGDLFCIRVAGNVVNEDVLASIEYACSIVGAKLIVVLGHTRCGAIQAACDGVEQGHITQLLKKINPAIQADIKTVNNRNSQNLEFLSNVTDFNVANTMQKIYHDSDILKEMINKDDIAIVGAIYDVASGSVSFKDYSERVIQLNSSQENTYLAHHITRLMETATTYSNVIYMEKKSHEMLSKASLNQKIQHDVL